MTKIYHFFRLRSAVRFYDNIQTIGDKMKMEKSCQVGKEKYKIKKSWIINRF